MGTKHWLRLLKLVVWFFFSLLAWNILFDIPGELGCWKKWKKWKEQSFSKRLGFFFFCWNVLERMLGQLARFWSQACCDGSKEVRGSLGVCPWLSEEEAGQGEAASASQSEALSLCTGVISATIINADSWQSQQMLLDGAAEPIVCVSSCCSAGGWTQRPCMLGK